MTKQDFYKSVFDVVKLIPHGRVSSYGAIAAFLGSRLSSRMVGWAMNQSHYLEETIPAHRVVNRNGMLTGKMHFKGKSMQELLENEGVKIKDDRVQDFEKLFWDPEQALSDLE